MPIVAVVREVSASFERALSERPPDPPIDVARARAEHAGYVAALRRAGVEVVVLPAIEDLPDGCFVEDTAVVAAGIALITRPGAPSRRAEPPAVGEALARFFSIETMTAPATLDGGDCLLLGRRLYVGRSARTNAEGAAFARSVFEPRGVSVIEVPVEGALHLKSVCSPLGDDAVLVLEGSLKEGTFGGARELRIPADEPHGANVVVVGKSALVPMGSPSAARAVTSVGLSPIEVDNRELRKADSALTCMSVVFDVP
jgi:dimethylargininase